MRTCDHGEKCTVQLLQIAVAAIFCLIERRALSALESREVNKSLFLKRGQHIVFYYINLMNILFSLFNLTFY